MGKFTKIPEDTFQKLQLNAGILVDNFTPSTGTIGNLLGATTGGFSFNSNPTYSDWGEDVDNTPANTKELKHLDSYDPTMSGTFLTVTASVLAELGGAADIDVSDATHIIPRDKLLSTDFKDVWWIGDYSDINDDREATSISGKNGTAGFLAIHLKNALNTTGIQITTSKNAKGQFAFEYHGHYSMASQGEVPFEFYCAAGTEPTE